MTHEMTSRERVLAALRGEPVDRTPLVNPTSLATVELMDLVDAPFPDARVPVIGLNDIAAVAAIALDRAAPVHDVTG